MADASGRVGKLADRIRMILAESLDNRIRDPRLGFVTITEVRVTRDLQHATVFYTVLGSDEERAATAAALESAKGRLRSEVGRNIRARLTPTLEFVLDGLPENAQAISDLLRQARERDAEVAQLAQHATYAGDADPYEHPGDDEAEA